jgi:hypothetical protein
MNPWIRKVGYTIGAILLGAVATSRAEAQGVTSAAITGIVSETGGAPITGAEVTLTMPATGESHVVTTRSDGRYVVDNASAGGPYRLAVRAIGYQAVTVDNLRLMLGQRVSQDVQLRAVAVQLEQVTIRSGTGLGPGICKK